MSDIDTILRRVAEHPGTSAGVPLAALQATWSATCDYVASMLAKRRSVIIPNFAHFIVQQHIGHSGTWGARVTWIPVFTVLPAFCQAYGISGGENASVTLRGATTPVTLNSTAIALHCNDGGKMVSRHGVMNSIKDIVREIGAAVSGGAAVRLNFGCCVVQFAGGRASTTWSTPLVESLNRDSKAPMPGGRVNTAHIGDADGHVPRPPVSARQSAGAPQAVPRPPSSRNSGVGAAPPAMPPPPVPQRHDSVSPRGSRPSSRASSARGVVAPFATDSRPLTPRSASARGPSHPALAEQLAAISDDLSPHKRRTARKLAYRRNRNRAFEASWERTLDEKAAQTVVEREQDLETANALALAQQREEANRLAEIRERREEAQRIQRVNLELARARSAKGVPRAQKAGDIFDARLPTRTARHDTAALDRQLEERRLREEHEKAETAAFGAAAVAAQQEYQAEERERKRREKEQRIAAGRQYELAAKQRSQTKAQEREEEARLAALTGLSFDGDGDVYKDRTLQIQKANYEMVKSRARERQQRLDEERSMLADSISRLEAREHALRMQENRAKHAEQSRLRNLWQDQMRENSERRKRESERAKNWRDVNFLRNESSDDEDDRPRTASVAAAHH